MTMIACPACDATFAPTGRRRYCSDACKQLAWRQRHLVVAVPPKVARTDIVYLCEGCDTRYLGERRCPDCNRFTRRIGPGGECPHCSEPVAVADILPDGIDPRSRPR